MIIGSVVCFVLLLFLYIVGRNFTLGSVIEKLSIFWFRLACAFLFLFIIHLIIGYKGISIPVNMFLAVLIAAFGVPGIVGGIVLLLFL
ncbi:MAG: hypothetical protein RR595_15095 [Lysinibacillus sp.]